MKVRVVGAALVVASLWSRPCSVALAQAPTVTVSGLIYAFYQYQLKDTANHVNNFDIGRAYMNVIGKFAHGIGTRVTGDIFRSTDGSLSYRLKYAYATWTPSKACSGAVGASSGGSCALTFKIGQMHTPLLDWEESLWDYRVQGPMAMERGGYVSSADFGAGVDGNWGYGKVDMQVGIYNGENYNKAPGDQRKDLMGRLSVRLIGSDQEGRTGGLRLTGYGQYGKPTGGGTRQRWLGMLSYRSKVLTLAGEIASVKDSVVVTPATPQKTGRIISVFGVVRIPNSGFELLGRFDSTDPNTDENSTNDRQSRVIAGASYRISPNLRLTLDLDNLSYQGGTPTPALEAVRSSLFLHAQINF